MDSLMVSSGKETSKPVFVKKSITLLQEHVQWIKEQDLSLTRFVRWKIMEEMGISTREDGT